MRETHVPLESVWERLVRAVEEGSKRPSKSLKGSKLRRISNLTFSKTGLKLHTKKQWLRLSLKTIEYATNTYKKYFYTFRINQVIFTYGERKKERPNFYRMFSQNLHHRHIENERWRYIEGVSSRVRIQGNFGQRGHYETREYRESPRKDDI